MTDLEQLKTQYSTIDEKVVGYVLNVVCAGNVNMAAEALQGMNSDAAASLLASIDETPKELTQQQKTQIQNFRAITGVKRKVAEKYLGHNAWRLEEAINSFYEGGAQEVQSFGDDGSDGETIEQLWNKYVKVNEEEEEEDRLSAEALIEFCKDLKIDPVKDLMILIISWLLGAKSGNYSISKSEWVEGFDKLGVETFPEIESSLEKWRKLILEKKSLKDFYRFVFGFSVVSKTMKPELACNLWKLIFNKKDHPLLDIWCDFIKDVYKKAITKVFKKLVSSIKEDMSNFDPEFDCYPSVMDEFHEFFKQVKEGGGEPKPEE